MATSDRPRPRPAPGPTPAGASEGSDLAARLGISDARPLAGSGISRAGALGTGAGTISRDYRPDLSRFLEASEPQPGDDEDDDEPRNGPMRRTGRFLARHRRGLARFLVVVVIAAVAAFLLRAFVVQPYYIPSQSMEPTLHGCPGCNDDHVLVDKISYRAHAVRDLDIVVFHRPPNIDTPDKVLIKRVVAVAGDVVQLKKGHVFVNGLRLDEPYLDKACPAPITRPETSKKKWPVPRGDVFVMGDNRCESLDSRTFGPISTSSIIGRAFAIIWPLNRIRFL